jgi:hypothetical protein
MTKGGPDRSGPWASKNAQWTWQLSNTSRPEKAMKVSSIDVGASRGDAPLANLYDYDIGRLRRKVLSTAQGTRNDVRASSDVITADYSDWTRVQRRLSACVIGSSRLSDRPSRAS